MSDRTFTPAEIDEVHKGARHLNGTEAQQLREQLGRQAAAAKAKREQAGEELNAERWERWKAKVKLEEEKKREQRRTDAETLAAMSVEEQIKHYARHPPDPGERPQNLPPRYVMALEDIRRDEMMAANREREEAEQRAGLPTAQRKWDAAVDAIDAKRRASFDQAQAAHDEALAAIRENAQRELDELGERPTLESLQAVTS
jgi:hypothetical protein